MGLPQYAGALLARDVDGARLAAFVRGDDLARMRPLGRVRCAAPAQPICVCPQLAVQHIVTLTQVSAGVTVYYHRCMMVAAVTKAVGPPQRPPQAQAHAQAQPQPQPAAQSSPAPQFWHPEQLSVPHAQPAAAAAPTEVEVRRQPVSLSPPGC